MACFFLNLHKKSACNSNKYCVSPYRCLCMKMKYNLRNQFKKLSTPLYLFFYFCCWSLLRSRICKKSCCRSCELLVACGMLLIYSNTHTDVHAFVLIEHLTFECMFSRQTMCMWTNVNWARMNTAKAKDWSFIRLY